MRIFVTCVLLAACSSSPPSAKSGSRLIARAHDVAVKTYGSSIFHDKKLGIDCAFAHVGIDEWRCLPMANALAWTGVEYGDASCSTRQAYAYKNCDQPPTPKYIDFYTSAKPDANGCGTDTFYEVGVPLVSTGSFEKFEGEACKPASDALDPQSWFALGAEVPLTTFARATPELVTLGKRFEITRLVAEDGASLMLISTLFDKTLDALCVPTDAKRFGVSAERVCMGYDPIASAYSDAACATPLARVSDAQTPKACQVDTLSKPAGNSSGARVGVTTVTDCAPTTRIYAIGDAAPAGDVYSDSSGSCILQGASTASGVTLHKLGAEIPLNGFATARLSYEGAGRIQDVVLNLEGGEPLRINGAYYDRDLKTRCDVISVNGKARCAPSVSTTASVAFADSECRSPLMSEEYNALPASCSNRPTGYARYTATDCTTVNRVFRASPDAAQQKPGRVYVLGQHGCEAQNSVAAFYAAEELSAEDLAPMADRAPLN